DRAGPRYGGAPARRAPVQEAAARDDGAGGPARGAPVPPAVARRPAPGHPHRRHAGRRPRPGPARRPGGAADAQAVAPRPVPD
ncbi:MAG: hypothetical protein AVDCRST_MAG54-3320, partial [uncultured Actinomycetospora sp.]